jgi:hypothetical protein
MIPPSIQIERTEQLRATGQLGLTSSFDGSPPREDRLKGRSAAEEAEDGDYLNTGCGKKEGR